MAVTIIGWIVCWATWFAQRMTNKRKRTLFFGVQDFGSIRPSAAAKFPRSTERLIFFLKKKKLQIRKRTAWWNYRPTFRKKRNWSAHWAFNSPDSFCVLFRELTNGPTQKRGKIALEAARYSSSEAVGLSNTCCRHNGKPSIDCWPLLCRLLAGRLNRQPKRT